MSFKITNGVTNRAEYIEELRRHLARLPETERSDILRDQEEFFREAVLSGRTEADVIGSLGDPKTLAKTLIAESAVAASENAFRMGASAASTANAATDVAAAGGNASFSTQMNATLRAFLAIITLAPFNLIFVLGPFLGLMGCLFAAWVLGAVSLVGGLSALVFIPTELTGLGASSWAHVSSMSFGLGVAMMSVAFLGMMTFVTSWVARLSVRYLRWNLDLIAARNN